MLHRFRRIAPDTWFALGLEFFAIVIGVLFALAVDEWRDERQVRHLNAIAVERLNEEIRRNHAEITASVNIIEERYGRLAAMRIGTDLPFDERVAQFSGFNFPDLKDSVWQRVSDDRLANRIESSYIDGAAELYNQNELLERLGLEISRLMVSEVYHDPARAPLALAISKRIMLQQIQWSREALARYEDFMQRHIPDAPAENP